MRILVALMLATLALAGCSEDSAPAEQPTGPEAPDVEVGADTGAISGIIVDPTIVPVAGVTVTLLSTGEEDVTEQDGVFLFEDLEPGTYFLEFKAPGFETTQASADVRAGEVAKPRIQMQVDLTPQPYVDTQEFKGHMAFSDILAVYVLTDIIGDNDLCQCSFNFTTDPGVASLVLETYWESSIDRVEEHDMWWDLWGGDGYDGKWVLSGDAWHVKSFGDDITSWRALISSGEQPDVDQSFQGFMSFWYVDEAPAGWSFGA